MSLSVISRALGLGCSLFLEMALQTLLTSFPNTAKASTVAVCYPKGLCLCVCVCVCLCTYVHVCLSVGLHS